MKSKKLIRNVLVMLSTIMMTAVMVLSSCGNVADGEHASITIRLNGSSSSRAISDAEKSAATFNVYFNDSLVASNVKGTYNGTAQVGTRLNIRLDAILNGKRIARGENTITVRSPSNDVDVTLYENREQSSGELKGVPQIGSIIMNDGTLRTSADIGSDTANAIAVVYKVAVGKAWAVGKVLSSTSMMWADSSANGYNTNITSLQEENGYSDGSTGPEIFRNNVGDADDLENMYPAWDYACNYGIKQGLTSFQTNWYLPSKQELQEIYNQRNNVPSSILNFGTNYYWSSSQDASYANYAYYLKSGSWESCTKNSSSKVYVCAVRQFTF